VPVASRCPNRPCASGRVDLRVGDFEVDGQVAEVATQQSVDAAQPVAVSAPPRQDRPCCMEAWEERFDGSGGLTSFEIRRSGNGGSYEGVLRALYATDCAPRTTWRGTRVMAWIGGNRPGPP